MDDELLYPEGYLVISRRPQESIVIGEEIELIVTKISGQRVWLAIKAPLDTRIERVESKPAH